MELTLCPRFFPPCSRACSTKILDRGFRSLRGTIHFFVFKVFKLNTRILSKIFERAVSAAAACSLAKDPFQRRMNTRTIA